MARLSRRKIGEILLEAEALTQEQLQEALEEQKSNKKRLGKLVVEKGLISEEKLLEIMEEHLGISRVNLYGHDIDPEVATSIPMQLAQRYSVIPLEEREGKIVLAMSDPMNIIAIDDVAMITQKQVEPVIASESAVEYAINQFFGLQESLDDESDDKKKSAENEEEMERIRSLVQDAPIVKVVNSFIQQAVNEGASDIHIEPSKEGVQVRMRIDGVLHKMTSPPRDTQPLIVSRIKIMANMDIAERRLPQDGKIQLNVGMKEVNMRVSTMPTVHGEKVVIRILEKDKIILPLKNLGFSDKNYNYFKQLLMNHSGMILVTGPTGCGKSTTLYSSLNHLNRTEDNIITVEDPVEYNLEGINQVQVNPRINLSFASALRTILRQDPNIIMVGEIRDLETAEIATRAALTGHLVLSTLHTNSAPEAVSRMSDMGVANYLITSSVVGVIAQRLVRKLCSHCQEEYQLSQEEKYLFEKLFHKKAPSTLLRGGGCKECNQTGYKGRMGIHEVLVMTQSLKSLVLEGASADDIKHKAVKQGMVPMLTDGLQKIEQGKTSLEEVVKVAFSSGLDEEAAAEEEEEEGSGEGLGEDNGSESGSPAAGPAEEGEKAAVQVKKEPREVKGQMRLHVDAPARVQLGETINLKYTLHNSGPVSLNRLVVKDSLRGSNWSRSLEKLKAGEKASFEEALKVPEEILDRLEGKVKAVAEDGSHQVEATCKYVVPVSRPGVYVEKRVPEKVQAGETVTFNFTVANRGETPLYEVTVVDPLFGEDWSYVIGDLASGTEVSFSLDYQVPPHASGELKSRTEVRGRSDTETVTDEDLRVVQVENLETPALALGKSGPDLARPGEAVTYRFTVSNTGNVPLKGVMITDPLFGKNWRNSIGNLEVGQAIRFTYRFPVPSSTKGTLSNTAQAMAETDSGQQVSAQDTHKIKVLTEKQETG